jgi:hypothetical protein
MSDVTSGITACVVGDLLLAIFNRPLNRYGANAMDDSFAHLSWRLLPAAGPSNEHLDFAVHIDFVQARPTLGNVLCNQLTIDRRRLTI